MAYERNALIIADAGGPGWAMPVSIEVHHALVDGLHVGRFFQSFQRLLDAAEV